MKSFFNAFKLNIGSNLAQLGLVYLFFPICALLIGWISGAGTGNAVPAGFLSAWIGKIPLCELWIDMIYQYGGGLTASDVASSTVLIILKALPEAFLVSVCVHVCMQAADLIGVKGFHIFSSFIGVFIATVIISLIGKSNNMLAEILMEIGVIIVMLIGMKIMFKSVFHGAGILSGKRILFLVIDGLYAVITTAYVSGLLMAGCGMYSSVGQAIGRILVLAGVMTITAVIAWLMKGAEKMEDPV